MNKLKRNFSLMMLGAILGAASTVAIQLLQKHISISQQDSDSTTKIASTPLLIKGEPALGSPRAPVTIVEFSDFECPYCKKFHEDSFPKLKDEYINKGLVRFIHKDLPLPFHDNAHLAASIARCSADDEQYWKVYKAFFDKQSCMDCEGPASIAEKAGLDKKESASCLKKGRTRQVVNTNLSEASIQSIRATPTFIIGPSTGERHRGRVVEGARPWPDFKKIIDQMISDAKSKTIQP